MRARACAASRRHVSLCALPCPCGTQACAASRRHVSALLRRLVPVEAECVRPRRATSLSRKSSRFKNRGPGALKPRRWHRPTWVTTNRLNGRERGNDSSGAATLCSSKAPGAETATKARAAPRHHRGTDTGCSKQLRQAGGGPWTRWEQWVNRKKKKK